MTLSSFSVQADVKMFGSPPWKHPFFSCVSFLLLFLVSIKFSAFLLLHADQWTMAVFETEVVKHNCHDFASLHRGVLG